MFTNIEKELVKARKELNQDKVVEEVRNIFENDAKKDVAAALRMLGENKLVRSYRATENYRRLEGRTEGAIFTRDQIKRVCILYNMRFLESKYFVGEIPEDVAKDVVSFAKKNNLDMNLSKVTERFYIIAPEKNFMLTDDVINDAWFTFDPVLLYMRDLDEFELVRKWGRDFTIFRSLFAAKWINWWTLCLWRTAMIALFFFTPLYYVFHKYFTNNNPDLKWWAGAVMLSWLIAALSCLGFQKDFEQRDGYFSPHHWCSRFKAKKG